MEEEESFSKYLSLFCPSQDPVRVERVFLAIYMTALIFKFTEQGGL